MNIPWKLLVVGLIVVVGLPVAGTLVRRARPAGCALDGSKIDEAYRVRIVDTEDGEHVFCCLRCAEMWLARQKAFPRAIMVTDETSGEEIDASSAWYVRSTVVTRATTGNCIHVFRSQTDAAKHAAENAGIVLPAKENPFLHAR
jgi:uncharacterized C2H2 Zn-finger protein